MRLAGSRCQCTACNQYFNSTGTFDEHRIGPYSNLRCLTTEQMTAKGWLVNEDGFWIRSQMSSEAKAIRKASNWIHARQP
jgi:hypothetical protein